MDCGLSAPFGVLNLLCSIGLYLRPTRCTCAVPEAVCRCECSPPALEGTGTCSALERVVERLATARPAPCPALEGGPVLAPFAPPDWLLGAAFVCLVLAFLCGCCCGAACARVASVGGSPGRRPFGSELPLGTRGPLTPSRRVLADA